MFFLEPLWSWGSTRKFSATSKLHYDKNKLVKRSGSFVYLPSWVPGSGNYTDKVFDTITYEANKVHVYPLDYTLDVYHFSRAPRYTYVLANGKPMYRSYFFSSSGHSGYDTLFYHYNNRGQLTKLYRNRIHAHVQNSAESIFTYNQQGNLINVITQRVAYSRGILVFTFRDEEYFESYDNAENPLSQFWLWDDFLYRSLSKNNFAKYIYKGFDDNLLVDFKVIEIPLTYDANGRLNLNP